MVDHPPSSSVCSLSEAPDAYRGYLAPAEIAAVLRAALAAAPPEAAAGLRRLLATLPAPAATLPAGFAAEDGIVLLERLLPRIRDDALHAAVKAVRETG